MLTKKIKKTNKKITIKNNTNKKTSNKIIKKHNYTKKYKNTYTLKHKKKLKNAYTQKGANFLNTISSSIISTNKKNYRSPSLFKTPSRNPFNHFSGAQKPKELLTINYNYRTPDQFIITPNNVYLHSKLLTAPHVQLSNFTDQFLLAMILTDVKPKLLWACNFKFGSKLGSVISYLVPQQPMGSMSTILFKLYRYPPNTINTFKIKNSMVVKRRKAFRKLKKYLRHHNMENSLVVTKQISVRQDKGTDITRLFTQITR
jgi:hypothetical protein